MARARKTDVHGVGRPNPGSVVAEEVLSPVRAELARAGAAAPSKTYRILITDQTDPYDAKLSRAAAASFAAVSDNFAGNDRGKALRRS